MKVTPIPLAERVAASRARAIEAGARKLTIMLPPEVAVALDKLQGDGYAPSATACIARALIAAASGRHRP